MAQLYDCTLCHKKRPGRFTRPRHASGGGWSRGLTIPCWYCYTCLPEGEGRDEATVAKKKTTETPAAGTLQRIDPTKTKEEGLQLVSPLELEVQSLTVETEEDYLEADQLRARIAKAQKVWSDKLEAIIRPIRQGLDQLYELNRSVDKPLEALKTAVTNQMKDYKRKELLALQEAARRKAQEEERLRQEAEEKARAAEQARTPQMRGKLQAQAERATQQAEAVAQIAVPEPVRAVSSTVRPVKVPKVADLNVFLKGVIDGYVPADAVQVVQKVLTDAYKEDPEGFLAWPGVVVEDDVQIVGR